MATDHISALNEYFSQALRIAGGCGNVMQEEYPQQGADHEPGFSCALTYGGHTVTAAGPYRTKKGAKQEAARLLLESLRADSTLDSDLRIAAMRGDIILRLILVEHFKEQVGITPGELQNLAARYGSNEHLAQQYQVLVQHSPGLPPSTGGTQRDATHFEAWIARVYDEEAGRLIDARNRIFPLLGVTDHTVE